jgi:hypothetical protein
MGFLLHFFTPFLAFVKNIIYSAEFKNYKKALKDNPEDHTLRARFAKYCLRHYFTHQAAAETHLIEAVNQFESIVHSDIFDLEIYYLMGKYYQGMDNHKAKQVYLDGIARFNRYIDKNPGLKHDYVEVAFAMALNLLTLQSSHIDPELAKFFKSIRKSYLKHFLDEKVDFKTGMVGGDPSQADAMPAPSTGILPFIN